VTDLQAAYILDEAVLLAGLHPDPPKKNMLVLEG
jgi:hypothetical protein